ncbi:hypothetical protein MMU07_19730 [Aquiflexum sp. LQ15W]|uniref:hypothetical protein n=1 Tax=Cognataquiflexum nitidum TaxID=2922272 RepID=UPI001F138532|nr:hypothetical protein [Cognataquiflexum nitidum]MCH6201820.1 hypothetical protein [Cognataquiflexum nitidum]
MKLYIYLSLIVLGLYSLPTYGQGSMIQINFAPALPVGKTADFTQTLTGRGANFEFYKMNANQTGYGVELGTMNFFEQVPDQIFERGSATLHGTQYRYLKLTPIMGSFIYVFNATKPFKPFVAMGAGAAINTQTVSMGIFVDKIEARQFIIRPELGAIYQLSDYVGIKLSTKYYQTFESNVMQAQSMLGFNLGFVMLNFGK